MCFLRAIALAVETHNLLSGGDDFVQNWQPSDLWHRNAYLVLAATDASKVIGIVLQKFPEVWI